MHVALVNALVHRCNQIRSALDVITTNILFILSFDRNNYDNLKLSVEFMIDVTRMGLCKSIYFIAIVQ